MFVVILSKCRNRQIHEFRRVSIWDILFHSLLALNTIFASLIKCDNVGLILMASVSKQAATRPISDRSIFLYIESRVTFHNWVLMFQAQSDARRPPWKIRWGRQRFNGQRRGEKETKNGDQLETRTSQKLYERFRQNFFWMERDAFASHMSWQPMRIL